MNSISDRVATETIGEILVQLRLLQYGVQATLPIKVSGNDLIVVNGRTFRAISVRTTTNGRYNAEASNFCDGLREWVLSKNEWRIFLASWTKVQMRP